ncbi:MAG: hypothetical protein KME47_09615 [Nodosilinea sp. WJT8-NPBG4]|jgi:hypothetical protein|nr:hypothetical protein [Nodosilinea sp. WJT8-NPBG4]
MPVTFLTDTELFAVLSNPLNPDYSTEYYVSATNELSKRHAFIKLQDGLGNAQ